MAQSKGKLDSITDILGKTPPRHHASALLLDWSALVGTLRANQALGADQHGHGQHSAVMAL